LGVYTDIPPRSLRPCCYWQSPLDFVMHKSHCFLDMRFLCPYLPVCSLSIFGCLSWFLLPITKQCITNTSSRSLPILETCLNHVNLRCAVLSTNVLSWCRMLRTVSFLILSRLDTRNNLLNQAISAAKILLSSSFLTDTSIRNLFSISFFLCFFVITFIVFTCNFCSLPCCNFLFIANGV